MKVIQKGPKLPRVRRIIDCRHCDSKIEIESGDETNLKRISDFRDGDYYEMPCPVCKKTINVAATLFV